MALHIGALNTPMAALVMALLLCLLLGCAGVAFVARKLTAPDLRRHTKNHSTMHRAA